MMTPSVDITETNFDELVIRSKNPVLVDFWAPRCGPCRLLDPVLNELAGEYTGKVKFYRLNRDDNPKVGMRYNVMSLPTLMVFKNGQPYSSLTGFTKDTKRALKETLNAVL
jgi:thioredoxin 1